MGRHVALVVGAYNEPHMARRAEYTACLTANLRAFDSVHVLREDAQTWADALSPAAGLTVANCGKRATFEGYFAYCARILSGAHVFVSNADIVIEQPKRIFALELRNHFIVLSKRQGASNDIVKPNGLSLDTWAFLSPLRKFRCNWYLGRPACEHRLAWEAQAAGLRCINPAHWLVCRHYHASGVRHYARRDEIKGPRLFVPVTPNEQLPWRQGLRMDIVV